MGTPTFEQQSIATPDPEEQTRPWTHYGVARS